MAEKKQENEVDGVEGGDAFAYVAEAVVQQVKKAASEKRTTTPAVPLTGDLSVLVKEVGSATGLGQRVLIGKIAASEEFAQAVRQVVSRAVDEHVLAVQRRIGFMKDQPSPQGNQEG